MEDTQKINEQIEAITFEIQEKYPELAKYLDEMPVTIPNESHPEINKKALTAYHESLIELVAKYLLEHPSATMPLI